MLELYENDNVKDDEWPADPEQHKNDMEYDMRTCEWLIDKVRADPIYAQNLYAAMCNNDFVKNEIWPILKKETWSCSWRSSGGIVADLQGKGDYMEYYCSGIKNSDEHDRHKTVSESVITDQIRSDLLRLGWNVVPYNHPDT